MKNKITFSLTMVALTLSLTGCQKFLTNDLEAFVTESDKKVSSSIPSLPTVQPFLAIQYSGTDLSDPFSPKEVQAVTESSVNAPDQFRKKEFLEEFPLDQLQMVGTILKNKKMVGLVKASDNSITMIKMGNYIGQNYGIITSINENEIILLEKFQDSAGAWQERDATISLFEAP